ncbi:MAG: M56 family metallopeptidase [Verrucomicrobiota bacterium]
MALSSVIILAAGIIALLLFRKSAAWRHQIWLNMLIGIWLLPTATWIVQEMNWNWTPSNKKHNTVFDSRAASTPATPTIEPALDKNETSQPGTHFSTTTQLSTPPTVPIPSNQDKKTLREWIHPAKAALFWTWLSGTLFLCSRWMIGWWRLRQIIRHSSPINQRTTTEILKRTVDNLDMKCCPRIHTSQQITTPMVIGTWNPSILLPFPQLQEISPPELEQILIHECAHIQRRDHWVWLLQRIGRTICWINPLYHWMHAELSRAREELCDNHVLQQWTGLDYAQTLSKVSNRWHQQNPMITGLAIGFRKHQLVHRVETLLDQTVDHRSSLNPISQSAFFILFSALILSCALVTSGLTQEQTKNSLEDTPPDSAIETSKLRPYPNDIKAQKYLMSDGKDIHEVEYYPWVEESDYQRVPKSMFDSYDLKPFVWNSRKTSRITLSANFAHFCGLTQKQAEEVNQVIAQTLNEFDLLKASQMEFVSEVDWDDDYPHSGIKKTVTFKWDPIEDQHIDVFLELRKILEREVEKVLGSDRTKLLLQARQPASVLSGMTEGMLSNPPRQQIFPKYYVFCLEKYGTGWIVSMKRGSIANYGGPLPEELDQYVPERMKETLSKWREFARANPPTDEEIKNLSVQISIEPNEQYSRHSEQHLVLWSPENPHFDIPKKLLAELSVPGLSIYNGISNTAATMLGLSDEGNRLLTKTYQEFDTRFRILQKQHMHPLSNESYNLQINAFPNEANKLKEVWLTFLLKTFGETQAHTIDKALRTVPDEYEYMQGFPPSILSFMSFPSRIWLESGTDSIKFYVLDERTSFKKIEWTKSDGQQGVTVAQNNYISDHQERILRSLFNLDFDSE